MLLTYFVSSSKAIIKRAVAFAPRDETLLLLTECNVS